MNKPLWQQQQEQMRKQQQDQLDHLHKMQMEAAWHAQQQKKQKAQAQVSNKVSTSATQGESGGLFSNIQAEIIGLKEQLRKGTLNADQVKERLKELMVQDDEGTWWTVGFESWSWYKFEGKNWIQADPTRSIARGGQLSVGRKSKSHPIAGIFWLLVFLGITTIVGYLVGSTIGSNPDTYSLSLLVAGIIWIGGLVLSIILARKIWRGKS
jgi:hypothetical protein